MTLYNPVPGGGVGHQLLATHPEAAAHLSDQPTTGTVERKPRAPRKVTPTKKTSNPDASLQSDT